MIRVAFEISANGKKAPIGHQFVKCFMVFGTKMEDFRQKARLVAGGHMTENELLLCMPVSCSERQLK